LHWEKRYATRKEEVPYVECRVGKGSDDGDRGEQNAIERPQLRPKERLLSGTAYPCCASPNREGGK